MSDKKFTVILGGKPQDPTEDDDEVEECDFERIRAFYQLILAAQTDASLIPELKRQLQNTELAAHYISMSARVGRESFLGAVRVVSLANDPASKFEYGAWPKIDELVGYTALGVFIFGSVMTITGIVSFLVGAPVLDLVKFIAYTFGTVLLGFTLYLRMVESE